MKTIFKYLPYEELNIVYAGSTAEICSKLETIIETDFNKKQPKKGSFTWKVDSDKEFGGTVFEDRFEAERLTPSNKNSFRPIITGLITTHDNHVTIKVIQMLPDSILGFSIIIFLGSLFGSIITIIYGIKTGYYIAPFLSLLFPFFVYLLVVGSFKNDSRLFRVTLERTLS